MSGTPAVAYFSMEVALDPAMPTYAGGLGVLAGDTLRSAADLEVPMVAGVSSNRSSRGSRSISRDGAGQPARRSRSIRSSIGGWVMNSRISPRRVAPEMPKAAIWSGKGSRP